MNSLAGLSNDIGQRQPPGILVRANWASIVSVGKTRNSPHSASP